MAAQVIVFLDLEISSEYDELTDVAVPITFLDFSLSNETIDPFAGGGGGTPYYQLRVRDSGVPSPAAYRIWTSINPLSAPPLPVPTGSWVERTILSSWLVGTL